MHAPLSPQHLLWLFGGAALIFAVLLVAVYRLQKSFTRGLKPEADAPQEELRVKDEAAFTLGAVKGVITQLKEEQSANQEKLLAAERRADENARKFDLLAREVDFGFLIFDAEGFIAFSNPQVRKVLAVDTWSRRRYNEIFNHLPEVTEFIARCFDTGTEGRKKLFEFPGWSEGTTQVEVSVLPSRDPFGKLQMVACVFREKGPVPSSAEEETGTLPS